VTSIVVFLFYCLVLCNRCLDVSVARVKEDNEQRRRALQGGASKLGICPNGCVLFACFSASASISIPV
jgi:hypothetical protein